MPPDHLVRQSKLLADCSDFILEKFPQRFKKLQLHIFGKSADIMMALDIVSLAGLCSGRLDNIRVDRPLCQPPGIVNFCRLFFEYFHKEIADDFSLFLRISFTGKTGQKALFRINTDNLDPEIAGKSGHHLIAFAQAEQPVVHKDTGQLVADGPMNQRSRNRRINSAGKTENNGISTDLTPDSGNSIFNDMSGRPLTGAAADFSYKSINQQLTTRRMIDFGMKLNAVE